MGECMEFPDTVEEFMEQYKLVDTEEVYSNGCEFVPIFRMKQWFEHQTDRMKFVQEAVNTLMNSSETNSVKDKCFRNAARFVQNAIDGEPQDFERIPDEPEIMPDGTLHITVITDVANIDRIMLTQAGTHSGDLYYKDDEKPEPKWTPCSERLPEVGTYVLVSEKPLGFRSNLPNVCTAHRSHDP